MSDIKVQNYAQPELISTQEIGLQIVIMGKGSKVVFISDIAREASTIKEMIETKKQDGYIELANQTTTAIPDIPAKVHLHGNNVQVIPNDHMFRLQQRLCSREFILDLEAGTVSQITMVCDFSQNGQDTLSIPFVLPQASNKSDRTVNNVTGLVANVGSTVGKLTVSGGSLNIGNPK